MPIMKLRKVYAVVEMEVMASSESDADARTIRHLNAAPSSVTGVVVGAIECGETPEEAAESFKVAAQERADDAANE